eukprot:853970-Pyramimonas_sp.AAC.1
MREVTVFPPRGRSMWGRPPDGRERYVAQRRAPESGARVQGIFIFRKAKRTPVGRGLKCL